jgi:hypothetical protein
VTVVAGTAAWPLEFKPQQEIVLPVLTPHTCEAPTDRLANVGEHSPADIT